MSTETNELMAVLEQRGQLLKRIADLLRERDALRAALQECIACFEQGRPFYMEKAKAALALSAKEQA